MQILGLWCAPRPCTCVLASGTLTANLVLFLTIQHQLLGNSSHMCGGFWTWACAHEKLNRGHIQFKSSTPEVKKKKKKISINPLSLRCYVFILSFRSLGKQALSLEWFVKVSLRPPIISLSEQSSQSYLSCLCFELVYLLKFFAIFPPPLAGRMENTIFTVCIQTQACFIL